jgi:hypothetical protein
VGRMRGSSVVVRGSFVDCYFSPLVSFFNMAFGFPGSIILYSDVEFDR